MRDSVPSVSYSKVCNYCVNVTSRSSLLIESTDSMIKCHVDGLRHTDRLSQSHKLISNPMLGM